MAPIRLAGDLQEALERLGLAGRLSWREVARLLELSEADLAQTLADLELEVWWTSEALEHARIRAIYHSLRLAT